MTHFWRCDILNRADVIDPFYSTWMQGMSYRRYSIIRRKHLFYTVTVPLSAHFYFRQDARGAGSQSSRNDTGRAIVNDEMAMMILPKFAIFRIFAMFVIFTAFTMFV